MPGPEGGPPPSNGQASRASSPNRRRRSKSTSRVYPAPFTGTGFTPSEQPIPEYVMELTELPAGTELWRFEPDGTAGSVGRYMNRQTGWIPTGDVGFGPARFWESPVPLRPTVRRSGG